ncbi:MAG: winged helix-turn-helix domain-containing protein [Lewinellaceae bacterium]|nr:winged helix-turn-helix domain-containing protein [Lewinellaceae bacterium]
MAYQPKILLCGNHSSLLQRLRATGGHLLQVEQLQESVQTLTPSRLRDVGMVFVLHMPPDTNGLAALRNWKRKNPDMPVVVLTTDYSGSTTRLLLKSGAEDVLELPAGDDEILACYEAYLPGFRLKAGNSGSLKKIGGKALLAAVTPGMVAAGVHLSYAMPPNVLFANPPGIAQDTEDAYKGLELSFFGSFTVHMNGRKIEFTNQAKHLFAYLAYHHPRVLSRDHLARTFWTDKFESMPEFARKSLNVELTHIRKTFSRQTGIDRNFLIFEKNSYRLNLDRPPLSDASTFKELHQKIQEHLRRGGEVPDELLQMAIKTYKGNFLDDFPADMFSWVEIERQHLSAVFEQLADLYSDHLCAKKDFWKAIAVCNEILSRDARMEVIHRRAMQCYASLGMAHKVEAQYNLCCKMMEHEFQSKPSPETVRLYEHIIKKVA